MQESPFYYFYSHNEYCEHCNLACLFWLWKIMEIACLIGRVGTILSATIQNVTHEKNCRRNLCEFSVILQRGKRDEHAFLLWKTSQTVITKNFEIGLRVRKYLICHKNNCVGMRVMKKLPSHSWHTKKKNIILSYL